jgi:hypothetical protein
MLATDGAKITVGGSATLGTVAKVLADSSATGVLDATITALDTSVTLAVGAGGTVNDIAFPAATSQVYIAPGAALGATASTVFANGSTETGAGIKLTVAASTAPSTATGFIGVNSGGTVTLTTETADTGSGTAYPLGNASFAVNNATTALPVTGATSTAGTTAAGIIKADTGAVVILAGTAGGS